MDSILSVRNLSVEYVSRDGVVPAVDSVSFDLVPGETYALVGESGCGKSATALSMLRLVEPGRIVGGEILFQGRDLMQMTPRELRSIRGRHIGMVFQESAAALNPVMRIGAQVAEAIRIHEKLPRKEAHARAVELLRRVALPEPERQARAYPHELSGGMKQRVMLAIALSCNPALLIADEPTTALDVTIQAQILELLRRLRDELSLTILLITHDLGVVAENADRVGVMYAGRIVEQSGVEDLFTSPAHPYTRGLLRSTPGYGDENPGRRLTTLDGSVPDPIHPPSGCRFHPRCAERLEPCDRQAPGWSEVASSHGVRCWLHESESS
ncbi:MAG: ABC transporter ATP-binding protein [Acidobacteriota bacterium]|nr:ABC transporter ATP-binding protein [Acidobacteriota bacterium]MDH3784469.1 ABC transporter ATP-binding protein [Acidobacteriota bacterium]